MGRPLDAHELHHALSGRWPDILAALGIDRDRLRNKHGPCAIPGCQGQRSFRFDDKDGRGTWICTHCGAGDGFKLLQLAFGWDFPRACREVAQAAGLQGAVTPTTTYQRREPSLAGESSTAATPTARVKALRRSTAPITDVADVVTYLDSRKLWPLPAGCTLRAHAAAPYYDGPELLGKYPALVADLTDIEDELVTCHVTWLPGGRKLQGHAPRKMLSETTGRRGRAVRLMPLSGDVLGVGEGLESCLAAHLLHRDIPVWSCLTTALLSKFIPPPGIHHVVIFADRDVPGMEAAWKLRDELDGQCNVELCLPPAPAKDWAEVLEARS